MPIAIHWRRLLPAAGVRAASIVFWPPATATAFLNRSATLPRAAPAPVFVAICRRLQSCDAVLAISASILQSSRPARNHRLLLTLSATDDALPWRVGCVFVPAAICPRRALRPRKVKRRGRRAGIIDKLELSIARGAEKPCPVDGSELAASEIKDMSVPRFSQHDFTVEGLSALILHHAGSARTCAGSLGFSGPGSAGSP